MLKNFPFQETKHNNIKQKNLPFYIDGLKEELL